MDIKIIKPVYYYVCQRFGQNLVSFYKKLGMKGHNGIDYRTRIGTPIFAPCDVKITKTILDPQGYGNVIYARSSKSDLIKGNLYKLEFVFGHLRNNDPFLVKEGDTAVMGQPIGFTGNTGKYTTGPHLHFGAREIVKDKLNWKTDKPRNGYMGFNDPEEYMFNSFQYEPDRFFKELNGPGFYKLGVDGRHHIIGNSETFTKLFAKEFKYINYHQLKIKLDPSYARLLISNKAHIFKILTGKVKSFKS